MGILGKISDALTDLSVILWDNGIALANLVSPKLKEGNVVPKGCPGHNLTWPPYVAPQEGDSRSACPMLNAMANHGILPHDGKNISFKEMNIKIRQTFNFAASFCFFVPNFSSRFLNKSYDSDRFDLADLSLHAPNAIEHDASLTRHDAAVQPDQGKPDLELVQQLLAEATEKNPDGTPLLSKTDLSRALSKRRADARRTNKDYSESFFHNMFGSANSSTMLTIFGGRVDDLTPMLTEERFSEHWEPRVLDRYGLTMAKFNGTVIPVERKVDTKPYEKAN
ncbi:Putative chloroperoxidase [Septoria linicola]|uniref:Chloroperoxidase n=1 Tax=Septoria linicola TaxID=215465 RepID=A0A9Q9AYD8_9PEZI|nr:putative chloroperoxidase [Septoria linicola]USW54162.1 Putative chloroperoxidase [Septoria linicola]